MTLNELRYIVAVAQELNFRRAAEKAYISQPALSLGIQKLEQELGVMIFERGKSEVRLTPVGQQIVRQAQLVLDEAERIRTLAEQCQDPLCGTLRLGVIYSVAPYLLPDLLPTLVEIAPGLTLEIEENLTANLEMHLGNENLDAAIIALPFAPLGMQTRPLYDEPFEVVVNKQHHWAGRASIAAQELAGEKVLLLDSGHCFSNQVAEACPELHRRGAAVQQGTSLETVRNLVASNLGITVLPASANSARYRSPLLEVIPFSDPVPARRIALAWRSGFSRCSAIEALATAIAQVNIPCLTHLS
ncbi:MAG: LysR substrate-binding domain-containing protein [Gallionella sp.]|nr:LysR substrate-binding domain-containing protein [Gallionella sp.]MDD4946652.1 LysR substrate-binding domain-containing protein [Gallionella sp.]MDD5611921.1 LysR substrate-binding domain-containing protein [Gallionella sp.]